MNISDDTHEAGNNPMPCWTNCIIWTAAWLYNNYDYWCGFSYCVCLYVLCVCIRNGDWNRLVTDIVIFLQVYLGWGAALHSGTHIIVWKQVPRLLRGKTAATLSWRIVSSVLNDDLLLNTVDQTPEFLLHRCTRHRLHRQTHHITQLIDRKVLNWAENNNNE